MRLLLSCYVSMLINLLFHLIYFFITLIERGCDGTYDEHNKGVVDYCILKILN